MNAYQRARSRRRGNRLLLAVLVAVVGAVAWPAMSAQAAGLWQRHVVDETSGLTAQAVAVRVGRALRDDPLADHRVDVVPVPGTDRCEVGPGLGIAVPCDMTVIAQQVGTDWVVTATRPGDTFTYDTRTVRL